MEEKCNIALLAKKNIISLINELLNDSAITVNGIPD